MKKILVLTPREAVGGFAIAGVTARVAEPAQLPALLDEAIADASTGVIAIDERLIDAAARERIRDIERRWRGAIVVLPPPRQAARAEDDYARRLIRGAIGYQVRVQL